jgi:hypothetical protein
MNERTRHKQWDSHLLLFEIYNQRIPVSYGTYTDLRIEKTQWLNKEHIWLLGNNSYSTKEIEFFLVTVSKLDEYCHFLLRVQGRFHLLLQVQGQFHLLLGLDFHLLLVRAETLLLEED